jgi:hypothetical protein
MLNFINLFISSFSLLVQRKRTKRKDSRSLGPALRDGPVLLIKSGRFGKSLSLRRSFFPLFSALLGGVKWQKT